jgi:hypothetical protein
MTPRTLSVVALLLLGCSASAQSDARLLAAIGAVESGSDRLAVGDRGQSLGQYQVQRAGWDEANARLASEGRPTYPRRDWRSPVAQDMVAAALLRVIRGRLTAQGIPNPSPAQIALCWTMGVTGAKAVGFDPSLAPAPKQSYAQRVANLVGR